MKYVTHRNVNSLTPAAQAIRDTFGIKLNRAKERHATAMGFNSFNHLSETVKKEAIESPLTDYISTLNNLMMSYHQINISEEQTIALTENLPIEENDESETIPLYIYALTPKYKQDEKLNPNTDYQSFEEPDISIMEIPDFWEQPEQFEHNLKTLYSGEPVIAFYSGFCEHRTYYNGLFYIISTKPLDDDWKLTELLSHTLITVSDIVSEAEYNSYEDDNEYRYYTIEGIQETIESTYQDTINALKKNKKAYFPILTSSEKSFSDYIYEMNRMCLHEFHYLSHLNNYDWEPLGNVQCVSFASDTSVLIHNLNTIYLNNFNSEFIESYSSMITNIHNLLDKNNIKYTTTIMNPEDATGMVNNCIAMDCLRNFKDEKTSTTLVANNEWVIDYKTLVELLNINEVAIINCITAIGHNDGQDMIFGCTAFDDKGNTAMQFQWFTPCAHTFYHEFLPQLKKDTNLDEFVVSEKREYNLQVKEIETPFGATPYTFSYPKENKKPLSLAFLILRCKQADGTLPSTSMHEIPNGIKLKNNPDFLPLISDPKLRKGVICPPVLMPIQTKHWHNDAMDAIAQIKDEYNIHPQRLQAALKTKYEKQYNGLDDALMVCPILFNLANDDASEVMLRYGATNEFSPESKNVQALSRMLGFNVEDYHLSFYDPSYKDY